MFEINALIVTVKTVYNNQLLYVIYKTLGTSETQKAVGE